MTFFVRYAEKIIPEPNSGSRSRYAHRMAYESAVGIVGRGLYVRHRCDNPSCVNPDHLEIGTPTENALDSVRRKRAHRARGEDAPTAKLSETLVREIRALCAQGLNTKAIRQRLGLRHLKPETVVKAARGITWSHLKEPMT
jgi:hypothetical protein